MNRLKKGDNVIIVAGKDKGRRGVVKALSEDDKVLVEGVNIVKKHIKPNPNKGVEGGVVDKEMPVHVSNVAMFNPATQKADKIGFKFVDGKKVRYFKSDNELVDL